MTVSEAQATDPAPDQATGRGDAIAEDAAAGGPADRPEKKSSRRRLTPEERAENAARAEEALRQRKAERAEESARRRAEIMAERRAEREAAEAAEREAARLAAEAQIAARAAEAAAAAGRAPTGDDPYAAMIRPAAAPGRARGRHFGVLAGFVLIVALPMLVAAWYLWARAADQYASTLGFSVHREDMASAVSVISGLSSLAGSSSADTDVINRYIYSQQVVQEIQDELDLRAMWSKPQGDPVFALPPGGTIEDLVDYWDRMVKVYYDSSTRLIEVRVHAFDPVDAQRIAQAIYEKSTVMINRLNDIASDDTVRHAREELEMARGLLVEARQAMTAFRNRYQIVDPASDVAAQATILTSLQQELASTLIDLDLLRENASENDPRLPPLERRIKAIQDRIEAERGKLGVGAAETEGKAYADVVAEFEQLTVDREFAEASYQAARAAYDTAQAEARRQSRYLAAHVLPTLAESPRYPERGTLLAVLGGFLLMAWAIAVLIFYSVRDRR